MPEEGVGALQQQLRQQLAPESKPARSPKRKCVDEQEADPAEGRRSPRPVSSTRTMLRIDVGLTRGVL